MENKEMDKKELSEEQLEEVSGGAEPTISDMREIVKYILDCQEKVKADKEGKPQ